MAENFPDHLNIFFNVDEKGNLLSVERPDNVFPNGPPPWLSGVNLATWGAQQKFKYPSASEMQTNPVQSGSHNTVGSGPRSFVYLDCGRWGGPSVLFPDAVKRDFAVICGRYVALCEFVPNGSLNVQDNLIKDGSHERFTLVNDLIKSLYSSTTSVRLIKFEIAIDSVVNPDNSVIYVIIPDLHLPISVKPCPPLNVGDGNHWGRFEYMFDINHPILHSDDEGMVGTGAGRRMIWGAARWFDRAVKTSVFGLPGGADKDLVLFMNQLSKSGLKDKVHFVHIGDMYDYWMGLERFFKAPDPNVVLLPDNLGIKTADFLNHWTNATHDLFGPMLDQMHELPVRSRTFLWGNHDNYLAVFQPTRPAGQKPIPARTREIRTGGIYIEHGQRCDPENRDGAKSGIDTTNLVFDGTIPYSFDPQRRNYYTAGSAAAFCGNPDFAIYVMGHTHERFLTTIFPYVNVVKK